MHSNLKKVVAIHDLSGFGRASLTTIIPTLSSMNIQVCPVPTALLSTHSGGFDDYAFHDLTDFMLPCVNHWKKLGLSFDCIYSGFLGSPKQIDIVSTIISEFRTENTLVVVDPVMGDHGRLYNSVSEEMVPQMRRLLANADITVPNFTEAALLLGENPDVPLTTAIVKDWLLRLSAMGPKTVLITSVPDAERPDDIHVVSYERDTNTFWRISTRQIPEAYPGTGDIFASVMIGNLLHGENLPVSIDKAVHFVSQCIQASRGYDDPNRNGVLLEKELPLLRAYSVIHGYEEF